MRIATTYSTDGATALAAPHSTQLKLVYDSRYDKSRMQLREQRQTPMHFGVYAIALAMVLLMGTISTVVNNMRHDAAFAAINSQPTESICVRVGDSLWTVASRHAVDGVCTNDIVEWIRASNDLKTSELHPGQRLIAPSAS